MLGILLAFLSLGYYCNLGLRTTHLFLGNTPRSLKSHDAVELLNVDERLSSSTFQSNTDLFASNDDMIHDHQDEDDKGLNTTITNSIIMCAACPPSLHEHLLIDMLVVDPQSGNQKTCLGILLRDDIILSTGGASSCAPIHNGAETAAESHSVNIPKVTECREQQCRVSLLSTINCGGGNVFTLYQVYPQQQSPSLSQHAGWPRLRVQLLLTNTTTGESENIKLSFNDSSRPPVLPLPCDNKAMMTKLNNLLSADILVSNDSSDNSNGANLFAPLTDDTNGDTWWVRKQSRHELVDNTRATLWKKYSAEHIPGALGLSEGSGVGGFLKMEDLRGRRDMSCLLRYYGLWKSEHPFSGVPFYDWLDFGAGRGAEHPRCPNREVFNRETYKCFTPTELDQACVNLPYRESTEDTTVVFHNGTNIRDGRYVYVWTLERNVHISPIRNWKNNNYEVVGHGTFTCGLPVYMAGEIVVEEGGVVKEINCESGHYKPQAEHLVRFMEYLQWQWSVDLRSIQWIKQPMFSEDDWTMVEGMIATA